MALNIIRQIITNPLRTAMVTTLRKASNLYEPDYLEEPITDDKIHKQLYVRIEGLDYPILEKYQSFIVKTTTKMGLKVPDSFALPHKELEVERYKGDNDIVQSRYTLKLYQRIIQIEDVYCSQVGSWIRVLEQALPPGVQLQVDVYTDAISRERFIPNTELLALKTELDEIVSQKN